MQEEQLIEESVILHTKSKQELADDLPTFSQINQSISPGTNEDGLFDLDGGAEKNKLSVIQDVKEDGIMESVILSGKKTE